MTQSFSKVDRAFAFQLDIEPADAEAFDVLMVNCGARTRADLFNNAVALLEWAVGEVQQGRRIVSCTASGDSLEVVRLPVIETASRNHLLQQVRGESEQAGS